MKTIDDGGVAFPVSIPGCGDNGWQGMSLRDYFAAKCIPTAFEKFKDGMKEYELIQLCGDRGGIKSQEIIAAIAYELADAMIARRSRAPAEDVR